MEGGARTLTSSLPSSQTVHAAMELLFRTKVDVEIVAAAGGAHMHMQEDFHDMHGFGMHMGGGGGPAATPVVRRLGTRGGGGVAAAAAVGPGLRTSVIVGPVLVQEVRGGQHWIHAGAGGALVNVRCHQSLQLRHVTSPPCPPSLQMCTTPTGIDVITKFQGWVLQRCFPSFAYGKLSFSTDFWRTYTPEPSFCLFLARAGLLAGVAILQIKHHCAIKGEDPMDEVLHMIARAYAAQQGYVQAQAEKGVSTRLDGIIAPASA
jgi:hypothetical protein